MAHPVDEEFLICIRVLPGLIVVKGSHARKCFRCNRDVWVAPSGLEMLRARPRLRPVCSECVPVVTAEHREQFPDDEQEIVPLTREQRRELIEEWKRTMRGETS